MVRYINVRSRSRIEFIDVTSMVQDVVQRYSMILDESNYVIAFHTRPSRGEHPYWHFHIEIHTPRNEHFVGVETGIAVFTNDSYPEEIAKKLREAI